MQIALSESPHFTNNHITDTNRFCSFPLFHFENATITKWSQKADKSTNKVIKAVFFYSDKKVFLVKPTKAPTPMMKTSIAILRRKRPGKYCEEFAFPDKQHVKHD